MLLLQRKQLEKDDHMPNLFSSVNVPKAEGANCTYADAMQNFSNNSGTAGVTSVANGIFPGRNLGESAMNAMSSPPNQAELNKWSALCNEMFPNKVAAASAVRV